MINIKQANIVYLSVCTCVASSAQQPLYVLIYPCPGIAYHLVPRLKPCRRIKDCAAKALPREVRIGGAVSPADGVARAAFARGNLCLVVDIVRGA